MVAILNPFSEAAFKLGEGWSGYHVVPSSSSD